MTDKIDLILEWIKKNKYRYSMNDVIYTVVNVCDFRIFMANLDEKLANMLNPFDFTWIKEVVDFIPYYSKNQWLIGKLEPEKIDIDKVLSVYTEKDKILPKDCNKCIHKSVCKMLENIYENNFKLGLLLSRFFEIYTDSNLAGKCVKYKEEVIKKDD